MSKDKVSDWSATPASNTDIGGISIVGTATVSNFDNAFVSKCRNGRRFSMARMRYLTH
jgi:hypothetical protein